MYIYSYSESYCQSHAGTYVPSFLKLPYGAKFWQGKILMNGHLENIDEKDFDEFHNVNAHIY